MCAAYLSEIYCMQVYFFRLIDSVKDDDDFVLEKDKRSLMNDQTFIREADNNDDDDDMIPSSFFFSEFESPVETAVNSRSKNVRREKSTEEKLFDILQRRG